MKTRTLSNWQYTLLIMLVLWLGNSKLYAQCTPAFPPFSTCGINVTHAYSGNTMQLTGVNAALNSSCTATGYYNGDRIHIGWNGPTSYTFYFSQTVNDVEFVVWLCDDEDFDFTTNGGTPTLTLLNSCNPPIVVGNQVQSYWQDFRVRVSTPGGYTSMTIYTDGSNGTGSSVVICSGTVATDCSTFPQATATASGSTALCSGQSVLLSSNTGSGYSYQWQLNGSNISGATSSTYTATAAGNYSVIVSSTCCSSTSNSISVTAGTSPTASIYANGPTTVCSGSTVPLLATYNASYFYQWYRNGVPISGATSYVHYASISGAYYCVVSNSSGCSTTTNSLNITVNQTPSISTGTVVNSTSCISPNGSMQILGSGTGTITWGGTSTGSIGIVSLPYTIANMSPGSYNFQFTTTAGCQSNVITRTITGPSGPTATITPSGSTTICPGGSVALNASTGSGYTYVWKLNGSTISGATSSTYSASAAGNYTVVVTNSAGCTTTSSAINVTVSTPTATVSASGSTTFCQGNATVLNANTGSGLSYQWQQNGMPISGATASNYTASVAGNYSVVVTNANGCSATSSPVAITVNSLPVASISPSTSASVCSGDSELFSVVPTSGATYQWLLNGSPISGATGTSYNAQTGGNYAVVVTNSNGCSSTSATSQLTILSTPAATITPAGATNFCEGGSVQLNAGTGSGLTYQWQFNGTPISGATSSSTTAQQSGNYAVLVSNSNGCSATSANQTITVNPNPVISSGTVSQPTGCTLSNGSVVVSGNGNGTINWSGTSNGSSASTALPYTVNGLGAGSYNISFTSTDGCASNVFAVQLNDPNPPTVTANATTATICSGESTQVFGSGASSYSWDQGVANNTPFSPASTGTYTVTGTDNNGCSATASVTITVHALPTVVANASQSDICLGSSVVFTGSGASSYVWDNNVTNGVNFTPASSGSTSYTVVGTDGNGCENAATVDVLVHNLPTISATSSEPAICEGESIVLTATGGTTYNWDNGVTNGQSYTPNGNGTFNYSVTGTDNNGCENTASVSVVVNALPTVVATATDADLCDGESVTLTASGASTYNWDNNVQNGVAFAPSASQTYTVVGTDNNGCTDQASVFITVHALPTVVANASQSEICLGSSVVFTGSGASSYVWDNNVTNGVNFTPASSGSTSYSVVGTDGNGCTNAATVAVLAHNLPTISATSSVPAICEGESIVLTATGGTTYNWDNGVTNGQPYSPNGNGTFNYSVTGTDNNGCENTASVSVVVNALPTVVATATDADLCDGESVTLTANGASTYNWDNNVQNGVAFTPSASQTYTVVGTDNNGCENAASITVTVNAAPSVFAQVDQSEICLGSEVVFSASGAATYEWSNGVLGGQSYSPASSGSLTYSVVGTDANGCTDIAYVTLLVNDVPTVVGTVTPGTINLGQDAIFTATGATTYSWTDGIENGGAYTPQEEGIFVFEVTGWDANGCAGRDTVQLVVNQEKLNVHNIVTPNGDGQNDSFVIDGLDGYPENTVQIFNRWGTLVFDATNYQNDWDGHVNTNTTVVGSGPLPNGTYFYIIQTAPDSEPIKGYVFLKHY